MKVAVLGANGQLGVDVCAAFTSAGHDVRPLTHGHVDVVNFDAVQGVLTAFRPDCVINTTAMHNVEQCEKDPAQCFAVNGIGARNLAITCRELGAYLVHISTDYVFDGSKRAPYVETDAPRPLNVYGNAKVAGEYFVLAEHGSSAIVRVSGLYGMSPCRAKGGVNFIQRMLKLAKERDQLRVVDDEVLTPTFTEDVSAQLVKITEARPAGIFHATAAGQCSWYEFARKIFELAQVKVNLQKAAPGEFPAKVRRPSYSVLDNAALRDRQLDIMPLWQEGLTRYLSRSG